MASGKVEKTKIKKPAKLKAMGSKPVKKKGKGY